MRRRVFSTGSDELDLVPLIDVVFLILLFFVICGRLSTEQRPTQVTVPPGRTAQVVHTQTERIILNLRAGERPALAFGSESAWIDLTNGWGPVRQRLDQIWDRAEKRQSDGHTVAHAILEIRADEALPYHLVQEFQQIAADSVDPATMLPGRPQQKSFTTIDFAAIPPG